MANMTKTNLAYDIDKILKNSGSDGAKVTNVVNYVWDCFVTQPSATAPTTVNEATALSDTQTTANLEQNEQWRGVGT
jgi:hypothetical protein